MKTTLAILLLAVVAMPLSLGAVTIRLNFIGGEPPGTNYTVGQGDPSAIMRAACDFWELAILDDWTLNVEVGWEAMASGSAYHSTTYYDGKPTQCRIVFDNDGNTGGVKLYLDPTPYDSSEYEEMLTTSADHGGGEIIMGRFWYAPTDPDAAAGVDMFHLALHELGHALGMSGANSAWPRYGDARKVRIEPPLPFAGTEIALATNCCAVLPHISYRMEYGSIMQGQNGQERRLPSYADILCVAQFAGWRKLNLDLRPTLKIERTRTEAPAIVLEAESGELGGFDPPEGSQMFNHGTHIGTTNQATPLLVETSGFARYGFSVPADGYYRLTAMVRALDQSSNSVWLDIDREPVAPFTAWHITNETVGFERRAVTWQGDGTYDNPAIVPKTWFLTRGEHVLYVRAREHGCEIDSFSIRQEKGGDDRITVSWSAHCQDWQLDWRYGGCGGLGASPFQPVGIVPTIKDGRCVVSVPMVDSGFFRLRKP